MPPLPQTAVSPAADGVAAALGRVPSGLFLVTWRAADTDRVMLASWVMQAGFAPPLVSVAVGTSRDLLAAARAGAPFAVIILADSQRSLLGRFGKPILEGDDPFANLAVERTPAGIAVLAEAAGWLECRPVGARHPIARPSPPQRPQVLKAEKGVGSLFCEAPYAATPDRAELPAAAGKRLPTPFS